jgi:hypothetical protein
VRAGPWALDPAPRCSGSGGLAKASEVPLADRAGQLVEAGDAFVGLLGDIGIGHRHLDIQREKDRPRARLRPERIAAQGRFPCV